MNKYIIILPLVLYVILELNIFNIKNIFNKLQKYFRIIFIILLCLVVFKYQRSDKSKIISLKDLFKNTDHYKTINSLGKFMVPVINIFTNKDNKHLSENFINSKNRKVTELTKKKIASDQYWKCKNCSNILDASFEVDHIIPLYKGGNNEIFNLQALCRNCHGKKTIDDKLNLIKTN